MAKSKQVGARTFFLNEQHEFAPVDKKPGGALPKFGEIDWASKGANLHRSLIRATNSIKQSSDPVKESHYFLLARPVSEIPKRSSNKKKAPTGEYAEPVDYTSKSHSQVFSRLGLDLLGVTDKGDALVHAKPAAIEKLLTTAERLHTTGLREQARWASLSSFRDVPASVRIDPGWQEVLPRKGTIDSIVELQPVLTPLEVDRVLREIVSTLNREANETVIGSGIDFSGRRWLRGNFTARRLSAIAEEFLSVQSLHPPFYSIAAAAHSSSGTRTRTASPAIADLTTLPSIGVVDTGIPDDHLVLKAYRRGKYTNPDLMGRPSGDHGARVASRVVFGEQDFFDGVGEVSGTLCSFFDINVAEFDDRIHEKSVIPAIDAVIATSPDVRVFNLSFGDHTPLNGHNPKDRQEKLAILRDLDNFAFARDVILVVAAGNSAPGQQPNPAYPNHIDDARWPLGHWALGFNSLVCGAYTSRDSADGVAKLSGWPSPFTRLGPGLCAAPAPGYSAPGGDVDQYYRWRAGLGEWVCNAAGQWEDVPGTSFAAPLLARDAAFALKDLQARCEPDTQPFSALVKAFLALTAKAPSTPARIQALTERALGRGRTSSARINNPIANSAVFLWQGVIPNHSALVRVQVPIPRRWLTDASEPRLRLIVAWETPVNDAIPNVWACRKVEAVLRLSSDPDAAAVHGSRQSHRCYPLIDRIYDLTRIPKGESIDDDVWVLELSYAEIADYFATADFTSQQRVAFAAELCDEDNSGEGPQAAVQALPIAVTMNRLSLAATPIRTPIIIKTRM